MEVKIDHDYRGESQGLVRTFKSRIGEWGPSFPVTDKQILVSENAGRVSWSLTTTLDGKVFVDGAPTSQDGERKLVPLDEVLARGSLAH